MKVSRTTQKLISLASTLAILAGYCITPAALPMAEAVSNLGQCLASTDAYTIASITVNSDKSLDVALNYSNAMMANSSWKNSKVFFWARDQRDVINPSSPYGYFAAQTPTSFSGNTANFHLAASLPPNTSGNYYIADYYDSGSNHVNERAIDLVTAPEYAIQYGYGGGICAGFTQSRHLPATGNYSFQAKNGEYYSFNIKDSFTQETTATATLTNAPTGKNQLTLNGVTLTLGTPATLNNLADRSYISLTTPDGETSSLYRPIFYDPWGGFWPSVSNYKWQSATAFTFDMTRYDGQDHYAGGADYPNRYRFVLNSGGFTDWQNLGYGTSVMTDNQYYNRLDPREWTISVPFNTNISSLQLGYAGSFESPTPYSPRLQQTYNQISSFMGVPMPVESRPTYIDRTPPTWNNPFTINDGATTTNSLMVTLSNISASDDVGVAYYRASNDNTNWVNITGNQNITWMLTPGASGSRTVYVQACDAWGNCVDQNKSITYNTTVISYPDAIQRSLSLPSLPAITYPLWGSTYKFSVQGDVSETTSLNVSLSAITVPSSQGTATCSVSNDAITWTTVPCNQTYSNWKLAAGSAGLRTVYARACNDQNRCTYTGDNITYNQTNYNPPIVSHLQIVPTVTTAGTQPSYTSTPGVHMKAYLNDKDLSGGSCKIDAGLTGNFSINGTNCGTVGLWDYALANLTSASTPTAPFKPYMLQLADDSAQISHQATYVIYDTQAPTATYLGYHGGIQSAAFTGPVAMACNDNLGCSNISYYIGSATTPAAGDWISCNANETAVCVRDLTISNGQSLYVRVQDNAGHTAYSTREPLTVNGAPAINSMTLVPTTAWGPTPGFTGQNGVDVVANIYDTDLVKCEIDNGTGTFATVTPCTSGTNTYHIILQTQPSPLRNIILRLTDSSGQTVSQTSQIILDEKNPTATYTGYTGGVFKAPQSNVTVTMNCNDDFGCQSISYYKGSRFNSSYLSCEGFDSFAGWQTCNPDESGSCTRTFDFADHDSLCVRVKDNAGRLAYTSPRDITYVDSQGPVFGQVAMVSIDGSQETQVEQAPDTKYYSSSPHIKAYFEVRDDNPTWNYTNVGLPLPGQDNECNVTVDGQPATAQCIFRNNDYLSYFDLQQSLPDGEHTVQYTVADTLGQPSTLSFDVYVDTKAPTYNFGSSATGLVATTADSAHSINVTLPSAFEDQDSRNTGSGSGIRDVRLTLTSQEATIDLASPAITIQPFISSSMRVEGNTLIIAPSTAPNTQAFPQNITVSGLPSLGTSGNQANYTVQVTAFDRAGNALVERPEAPLHVDGLNFDTLAPTIGTIVRPGSSDIQGNGTPENPYRVGQSLALNLRIPVTEQTNNYKHTPNAPIGIYSLTAKNLSGQEVPGAVTLSDTNAGPFGSLNLLESISYSITGGLDPDINGPVRCDSLDSSLTCQIYGTFTVQQNFVGTVSFDVSDAAGNFTTKTFSIKQDSNPPLLGANFTLTSEVGENTHYKGDFYRFTATDVNKNGDDKVLNAFVTYIGTDDQPHTINNIPMTASGSSMTYTLDARLTGVKSGAQNVEIYFEDNYGNHHDGSAAGVGSTINYGIFHDAEAPVINGFSYSWSDNNVMVQYNSVTEASAPLRIQVETSADGQTWTTRDNPVSTSDLGANSFTIQNVQDNEQLRVLFADTVKDYQNQAVVDGQNPRYDYIFRDIVLTVTEGNERLNVSYTPENGADLTNFRDYTVTYTGPNGRTGSFPVVTSFNAQGGTLGTIDAPLKGNYTFTVDLGYNDSTPTLHATKTYAQTTDIVTPRATMSIPLVPTLVSQATNGTYYVRSIDPALNLAYSIDPEWGSIFDDSLPLTLTITGAEPVSVQLNPTGNSTFTGTQAVNLFQEQPYDLRATISDGAGHSVATSFHVVKDKSVPVLSSQFVSTSGTGTVLNLLSNEGDNIYLTKDTSVYMDVIVSNESEPVVFGDISGASKQGAPVMANGLQTQRYLVSNLANNDITTLGVTVTDTAGSPQSLQAKIRQDDRPPEHQANTPSVLEDLTQTTINQNPVGVHAIYTDYSQVDYVLTVNGQTLPARQFTGSLELPQGQINSLSIAFRDQLGNQTDPTDLTIDHPIYVDSIAPTADITFDPNAARTKEDAVHVNVANLVEDGPSIAWEARNAGAVVASGTIMHADFATTTILGDIPLTANTANQIVVTLTDSLGNRLTSSTLNIIQDNLSPDVAFNDPTVAADGILSWSFKVTDASDSGVGPVSARLRDLSNGMASSTFGPLTPAADGTYSAFWGNHPVVPGHHYVIEVSTTDGLENAGIHLSQPMTVPTTPQDDNNPLIDPIPVPPTITGTSITVTVSNGTTINYVATDLPRGENIYLSDVLAAGHNTVGNNDVLTKFPVGTYTITIEDNLGNREVINNYLVTPYYFDPAGDLDGDGFGGGVSDHKLLEMTIAQGNIYPQTAEITAFLDSLRQKVQQNIVSAINPFFQH